MINSCVGCGLCGEVAHAAVLCPSFYRASIDHQPDRLGPLQGARVRGARDRLRLQRAHRARELLRRPEPMTAIDQQRSARSTSRSSPWAAKAAACWPTGSSISAEHDGYIAQTTSVPGVAQRTGATIYYVELFPKTGAEADTRAPVLALMPVPGDVDIVIASELMEAGRAVQRGLVTPDRTTLIASTNRVYAMTEKIALGDGRVDPRALLEGCQRGRQAPHPLRHGAARRSHRQRDQRGAVRRARRLQALPLQRRRSRRRSSAAASA